jgi:hypothetical protein
LSKGRLSLDAKIKEEHELNKAGTVWSERGERDRGLHRTKEERLNVVIFDQIKKFEPKLNWEVMHSCCN